MWGHMERELRIPDANHPLLRLVPAALEVLNDILLPRTPAHLITRLVSRLDDVLWVTRCINNLDPLVRPPLAIIHTVNHHISAVDVELGHIHRNPRPYKQALAPLFTARRIVGDLDRPLVVEIRTRLFVLPNQMERLPTVVAQRVLAEASTVARLIDLCSISAGL